MDGGDSLGPTLREARLLLAQAGATMKHAALLAATEPGEELVLSASVEALLDAGLSEGLAGRVVECRLAEGHRRHEDDLRSRQARAIVFGEPGYPLRLTAIPFAPAALFVRGSLPGETRPAVALVGSRRCTPEGARLAEELAKDLSGAGVVIVSGLARGIDAAGLRGSLRGGAPAVGVLGSGLAFIYPPENEHLFRDLEARGALVSEFPLFEGPRKEFFPRRNRLISGLADGVLVVEASDRSGSLITVDHGLAQNRVVMAVPGLAGPAAYRGTNRLIRDGAQVVLEVDDVFTCLGIAPPAGSSRAAPEKRPDTPRSPVLRACADQAMTPDAIALVTGLDVRLVLEELARLEADGAVRRCAGARFLALRGRDQAW